MKPSSYRPKIARSFAQRRAQSVSSRPLKKGEAQGTPRSDSALLRTVMRSGAIFFCALIVVVALNMTRSSFAAKTEEQGNKYLNVLKGGDFKVDCAQDANVSRQTAGSENQIGLAEIDRVVEKYHEVVNCIFNNGIKDMVKAKDVNALILATLPPGFEKDKPNVRKPCVGEKGKRDISTYCMAVAVADEYFSYRDALIAARAEAQQKGYDGRSQGNDGGLYLGRGGRELFEYGKISDRIDDELNNARIALDQTLAAYNEMQLALPLHKKYLEIITALSAYRKKVSQIRDEIELYPDTFLDVTTTACT